MPRPKKTGEPPIHVTIVSNNPETLDDLRGYLEQSGVRTRCTSAMGDLSLVAPEGAVGTVLFPDDFAASDVSFVREIRRQRPRFLILIVTREPNRVRAILDDDARSPGLVVLPIPSFGWDILDAIRAHAREAASAHA